MITLALPIVENLNLEHWDEDSNSHSVINQMNDVNDIIKKYTNHPSIKNIKKISINFHFAQ